MMLNLAMALVECLIIDAERLIPDSNLVNLIQRERLKWVTVRGKPCRTDRPDSSNPISFNPVPYKRVAHS